MTEHGKEQSSIDNLRQMLEGIDSREAVDTFNAHNGFGLAAERISMLSSNGNNSDDALSIKRPYLEESGDVRISWMVVINGTIQKEDVCPILPGDEIPARILGEAYFGSEVHVKDNPYSHHHDNDISPNLIVRKVD